MASARRCSSRKTQPGSVESGSNDADAAGTTTAADDDDGGGGGGERGYVQVVVNPKSRGGGGFASSRRAWKDAPPWLVSGALVSGLVIYQTVACHIACVVHRVCAFFVPVFSLLCAYYWLSLFYRKSWTATSIYLLSCACFVGELAGQCLGPERGRVDNDGDRFPGHLFTPHVHGVLLLTLAAASALSSLTPGANASVVTFVVLARFFACTNLTDVPARVRPFVAYGCGLVGVVVSKYIETLLRAPFAAYMAQEGKVTVFRRRRTSSAVGLGVKARRTSLPAISLQKNHLATGQHSPSALDVALLAEAHGLITDMLAETNSLPQHVVSGLRVLSKLLSPPLHSMSLQRPRLGPMIALTTVEATSGSETEEIPCMGEKIITISKRCRRNLPSSFLHRMSLSVSPWTTTTSATGMPTLEPEPSRKRSASFRHSPDASSPTYSPHMSLSNQAMSTTLSERFQAAKNRSYSTTSLVQLPSSPRSSRLSRERKTVCSLHPLTASDIRRLHSLSRATPQDAETDEEEQRHSTGHLTTPTQPPSSAIVKRLLSTSDYDSSDSPNSSDNNETVVLSVVEDDEKISAPSKLISEQPIESSEVVDKDGRSFILPDESRFDLNVLETDPLWNSINEWDYSIFEVADRSHGCILSQMCYRIFVEVELFETFKIPLLEFFNYFHALEMGYQDKPYHNRTHAADVLHAVYYLTSQAIPGFAQLPESDTPPPVQKNSDNGATVGLVPRQSFNAEDTYGIMGANFPALELMALYVASAMHDYDHPGRTNAFLVMTHAPQAVLYNDRSVLENHHAASAWSLLLSKPEYNFLVHLDKAEFKRFRFLVIEAILATDLKRHFDILREFNEKTGADDAPGLDWTNEADRLITMEMCIKLADISGPCKRFDLHSQWTHRIAEEFYEQGDEELALGLAISPFMDRRNPQLAKLQESFITHLVQPLCHSYGEAGLLPGQWLDDLEDEETEEAPDTFNKDTEDETEEERPDSNNKQVIKNAGRRMTCLQTIHLRENHDHWIAVIKEEEQLQAEMKGETTTINENIKDTFSNHDEMETINEEEVAMERILRLKENNMKQTSKDTNTS